MFEVLIVSAAFVAGMAVKRLGLPPLVGFLVAGFVLNGIGAWVGLPSYSAEVLEHVAHVGVLLLLFTIGLKLKIGQLLKPYVVGTAFLHFAAFVAVLAPLVHLIGGVDWSTATLVAIALSFSSTVLAAKSLEAKREIGAFHGRAAIGILIIQDLIALVVIAIWSGQTPSWAALWILALPLIKPVVDRLLDWVGHDEVLVLMGLLLAVVVGGYGFDAVGVSGELGALAMGVLLGGHQRAKEMSESLWSLKEVFLVGFFLQIGMQGLPDAGDVGFALALAVLLPLKAALFFGLLAAFGLRARNAFLGGLTLTAYSEFALIVAAAVLPQWLVPLAVAVALSFVIAAPLQRFAHPLYERLATRLEGFERRRRHPDEVPADLGSAEVVVMGMGRVGSAVYDALQQRGLRVVGLDADPYTVTANRDAGRNAVLTDAEDADFWQSVPLDGIRGFVLAMNDLEAKVNAAEHLRAKGFRGALVAHALHADDVEMIQQAGADETYLTMQEAGLGLGERVWSRLDDQGAAGAS